MKCKQGPAAIQFLCLIILICWSFAHGYATGADSQRPTVRDCSLTRSTQYKVVHHGSRSILVNLVNDEMREGWKPQGSVSWAADSWEQGMVRSQ